MKNYLSKEITSLIVTEIKIFKECCDYFGDKSCYMENSFNWYSPPSCEALLINLKPAIEEILNLTLYPTYSYARIYYTNGELKKHLDRKSSEYVATCCLHKETYYPITIDDGDKLHHIDLNIGDVLIFPGRKYYHWRDKYEGKEHIHCFLQYVNANGQLAEYKYDTRPCIGANYQFTSQKTKNEMMESY